MFLCNMSYMPLILIIRRVRVCKFTSLLKCICNFKISTGGIFTVIHGQTQSGKKFEFLMHMFLAEVQATDIACLPILALTL